MCSSLSQGHLPGMAPVPPAKETTVASSALAGGRGADTHGCATGMDQKSSDGALHPLQGLQAGKSQPHVPRQGPPARFGLLQQCRVSVMVPVQNNGAVPPRPAPSLCPYLGEVPNELLVIIGQQVLHLLKLGRLGRLQTHSLWRRQPETPPDVSKGSGRAGEWPSPASDRLGLTPHLLHHPPAPPMPPGHGC